jgi:outer membrane protein assembly factor BamB
MPAKLAMASAISAMLATVAVLAPLAQGSPDDVPEDSWATNGRVNAILQVGNVVYLGGRFTEIREHGGAGPRALPRAYVAALDATTGAPIEGWDPSLNGEVYALAPSPDGSKIYAGGVFTTADGLTRSRLVALGAATGEVDPQWLPHAPNGSVRTLAVGSNRIYAGGGFIKVGAETRQRLAAFDTTTGALDPIWQPAADNMVRTITFSAVANRVYAGGDFDAVSGKIRLRAVALDPASGAVAWNWRPNPAHRVFGLVTKDSTVYAAVGGDSNSLFAWDANTASQRWRRRSDGDFQALAVSSDTVYGGGHFNNFEGEPRRKLVAVHAATGALRRDWSPRLPHTTATWYGVSALSAYGDTNVSVGGDFDSVSGLRREHFAQFTVPVAAAIEEEATTPPKRTASDTTTPVLHARVKQRQRVRRLRGVVAYARCDEPCTIAAGGTLRIGRSSFGLRRANRAAQAAERVRVKVWLTRTARRALRRALRRGRRPSVRVGLQARDAAGNLSRQVRATVRVRR